MTTQFRTHSIQLALVAQFAVSIAVLAPSKVYGQAAAAAAGANTTATSTAVVSGVTSDKLKSPCAGGNMLSCGMMALAAYQVISSLTSATGSGSSASSLSSDSSSSTTDPTTLTSATTASTSSTDSSTTSSSLSSLTGELLKSAEANIAAAKAAGVTVSSDGTTATTSEGTVSSTSTGSSSAAQSAGFSASDYAEVQDALASAQTAAAVKLASMNLTNADGAGGAAKKSGGENGSGGGMGGSGSGAMDDFAKRLAAMKKKDASVAGLSKKLGSDNIGVSQDNIFEMISRRYKAKDKENAFLKE